MTDVFSVVELSELFREIGRNLATEDEPDAVLYRLAELSARRVPGAEYAGITIGRTGGIFETVAASDELVLRTDQIQYDMGTGPCVDAVVQDLTFNASDLSSDPRWPEFGRRAVAEVGIVSMLSLRLYMETERDIIAGLNMYSHRPAAFDASSETIALLLATHGALAASKADAQHRANNLLAALKTSREIGVAMGILMSVHRITRDQAFDMLRIASQHTHRKLAEIATEVADTGVLPPVPSIRGKRHD